MAATYSRSYISNDDTSTPDMDETSRAYSLDNNMVGNQMTTLPTATRTGYTTTGWYTEPTGGSEITDATIVTVEEDYYSIYAQYKAVKYAVTLDTRGGTISDSEVWVTYDGTYGNSTDTSSSSTIVGLPTPTRTGADGVSWVFTGWVNANNEPINTSTIYNVANPQNHTLYANWTRSVANNNAFVLTYNAKIFGENIMKVYGNVNDTYASPTTSYTFTLSNIIWCLPFLKNWLYNLYYVNQSVKEQYPTDYRV